MARRYPAFTPPRRCPDCPESLSGFDRNGCPDSAGIGVRFGPEHALVDTSLVYDVEIQIFDGSGRVLAAERFEGEDDLGGRHWYPSGHAAEAIGPAVKARIEELFEASTIRAALRTQWNLLPRMGGSRSSVTRETCSER